MGGRHQTTTSLGVTSPPYQPWAQRHALFLNARPTGPLVLTGSATLRLLIRSYARSRAARYARCPLSRVQGPTYELTIRSIAPLPLAGLEVTAQCDTLPLRSPMISKTLGPGLRFMSLPRSELQHTLGTTKHLGAARKQSHPIERHDAATRLRSVRQALTA